MDFLKKHYEKIILSLVLLGLAVVAAKLPMQVNEEKQKEEARKQSLIGAPAKPFPPIDLATNIAVLEKVKTPIRFEIAGKHNLFNPVLWQKRPDGSLIKVQTGGEIGINAVVVTAISPLQMIVQFDDVSISGKDVKYQVSVIRETDRQPRNARTLGIGQPSPLFTIRDIKGAPEAPTELQVLLAGDSQPVVVTKDKPYTRVIGYQAAIDYPPTGMTNRMIRKGDALPLGDETYNVVAITADTVIFSAKSNSKQTPVKVASSK
jgi:hypothetical protein